MGVTVTTCKWLIPQAAKDKVGRGKHSAEEVVVVPPTRHKGGGASSSAVGEIGRWIPVNSTVTTTSRVTEPISTQTTQATSIPIPSIS